jgi:hypothetical protein
VGDVSGEKRIAPFPWFGGKAPIAPVVWQAIGADVPNYVEPFAGSAAVLLARPGDAFTTETINDADGMVANFWRAVQANPAAVLEAMDFPVCETELTARHLWLIARRAELTEQLSVDVDFFDARAAGYWCWGACAWIGSGWCDGQGPWSTDGKRWFNRRQLPHLGDAGMGINRQLPHLGNAGRVAWIQSLSERLSNVRVTAGDWRRVLTPVVTIRHGITGVLLDPPYPAGWDTCAAYAAGSPGETTWYAAAAWAVEAGSDRRYRIVLCGYDGTWAPPPDWRTVTWAAHGGYANAGTDGDMNRVRERLWLSPGCRDFGDINAEQLPLFGAAP